MKIAVVGGGSTYTPELVNGAAGLGGAATVNEMFLIDPDRDRLEIVGPFCRRVLRAMDHSARVRWTTRLDVGLDGADAVVVQLRVGGQAARARDETWPLEYGCLGQETTGVGGLAKAMRTVPVVLDVAERVRRWAAPSAWIVNFTNPVGIVTRALLDAGHRAVGLCNVAITLQRHLAGLLDVAPARVRLDHVGLNHLTWARAAVVDGRDRLPELLDTARDELARHLGLPAELLDHRGGIPSYYLRYFYRHDAEVAALRGAPTRAGQVAELERRLLAQYADPELDRTPELLSRRGGAHYSAAALLLLDALVGTGAGVQAVDVRNAGTFPFLPADAVVEVPAAVDRTGARPLPAPPLDAGIRGLVAHVAAYEELALDAALHGGRRRVETALLAHPLVGQWDTAVRLADRLLAENAAYLDHTADGSARP